MSLGLLVAPRTSTGAPSLISPSHSLSYYIGEYLVYNCQYTSTLYRYKLYVCVIHTIGPQTERVFDSLTSELPRLDSRESISSIKITAGANFLARLNMAAICFSVPPTNLSLRSLTLIDKNADFDSFAIAVADKVLPNMYVIFAL